MDVKFIVPTLPTHGYATVYVYPTISPHIVVIPIVSCIIGFPVFVLLIICALRSRARKARMKAKRRRPLDHTITELVPHTSFNQSRYFNERVIRTKDGKRKTIVRFKPMPELDLDTVVEEKSEFDAEVNVSELLATQKEISRRIENHSASFRSYRYGYGASGQPLSTANSPRFTSTPTLNCSTCVSEVKAFSIRPTLTTDLDKVDEEEEGHDVVQEVTGTSPSEPAHNTFTTKAADVTDIFKITAFDTCIDKEHFSSNYDPVTFSPTSHSDSRTTLRESSTTISSKDHEYVYPNSASAANILSLSASPVRCHVIDIGGVKRTPDYVNIKGNTVEHIDLSCLPSLYVNKTNFSQIKFSKSCEKLEAITYNPRHIITSRINIIDPCYKEISPIIKFSDTSPKGFSSRMVNSDQCFKEFNPPIKKIWNPNIKEFNPRLLLSNQCTKEDTILRKFRPNLPGTHNEQDNKSHKIFYRSDESLVTAIIRKYEGFATNDHIVPLKNFPMQKT